MSTGSVEESGALETLLSQLKFPTPPSSSPNEMKEPTTTAPPVTHQGGSRSFLQSLALAALPSPLSLSEDKETFIEPRKKKLAVQDGQFQKGAHYLIEKKLGFGGSGQCYKAITISNSIPFCIKKCKKYIKTEIAALLLATNENNPHVVGFFGAKLKPTSGDIFMEYMPGGTISELVEEKKTSGAGGWPIIAEETCFVFLEDILKGLAFLRGIGLVHGDIKGDNILLNKQRTHVKVADLGSAHSIQEAGGCSEDIWKTGCLYREMLDGERLPLKVLKRLCVPENHFPLQAKEDTKELLDYFFEINRRRRLTVAEILHNANAFKKEK